jgi:hypothetical protein
MSDWSKTLGEILQINRVEEKSKLDQWFNSVLQKRLDAFNVGDLCIAIRQKIALDHIIPAAIQLITQDVLAGDQYDGELLSSLLQTERSYWATHTVEQSQLKTSVEGAIDLLSDDLKKEYESWS